MQIEFNLKQMKQDNKTILKQRKKINKNYELVLKSKKAFENRISILEEKIRKGTNSNNKEGKTKIKR